MNGFLLDENLPLALREAISQQDETIPVYVIGEAPAPPFGSHDPDLLVWIEAHVCLLVTNNRASMPGHLAAHLAQGRHVPGILQVPRRLRLSALAEELALLYGASLPEEYQDRIMYLPSPG